MNPTGNPVEGEIRSKRVLVLAAHTDDAELGSGATISRLVREGADVHIVAFSAAEQSVPSHLSPDVNREDALTAAAALSVPEENVEVLDLPVRHFPQHRQHVEQTGKDKPNDRRRLRGPGRNLVDRRSRQPGPAGAAHTNADGG